MHITELLTLALHQQASDLHLSSGSPPMLRIDGQLQAIDHPRLHEKQIQALLFTLMNPSVREKFDPKQELDFSYALPDHARFRVHVFQEHHGLASAFRVLPSKMPSLEDFDCANLIKKLSLKTNGLLLITGPSGSGKSSTLAAILDHINKTQNRHIITLEDPIEYLHQNKKSLIQQREIGKDTASFNQALRSALRQDPDVLFVGEMRDLETIRLVLTAAETGHLVLSSLHTQSAAKTIARIVDVFPGEERPFITALLADTLQAVIAQTLIPRVGGGRILAQEIMLGTPAILNLIRQNKPEQLYSAIQTGQQFGMRTLRQHIDTLVATHAIIPPEV